MNVELLEKIKAHIKAEPRRLNMEVWLDEYQRPREGVPPCGTVGCIAGWAAHLSDPLSKDHSSHVAPQALGIHFAQRERLFYQGNWPQPFRSDYVLAETPEQRVEVTCARIDHFINTGE